MDSSKSKSAKVLRKLTTPETKPQEPFCDLSNYKTYLEPHRSTKGLVKTGFRPTDSAKKQSANKSYLINKTALGSPY